MNRQTYYKNRPEKDFPNRPEKMWEMYKKGITQQEIANTFGITSARVSQILKERTLKQPEKVW